MIGRSLSHYRVTAALGAGGMGEVWRARDTKLDRDVAIKMLPAELTRDPERLARLERIVSQLEGGGLELEPAIAQYKDGVKLLKECREILGGYRKQVEELSRSAAETEPYAADPDAPPQS